MVAALAPRGVARKWRNRRDTLAPVAVLVSLLALWQLSVDWFSVPVYLLPSPTRIVAALWAVAGEVAGHALATLLTIFAGFLLSIVIALPLAALLTLSPAARAALYPLLVLSQSIPKVALAPILVLVLGTNILPKIMITFLVAFFPLVIATSAGLSATPRELIELGRSLQATRFKELVCIRLPFAIPFIFSGLKMSITFSVIGAVVGEFVAADRGLGYLMTSSLAFFNTPLGYGAIVILSLLAILLFQTVVVLENVLFPWSARMRT
jgi:NitT/TauT family transport system permease protein